MRAREGSSRARGTSSTKMAETIRRRSGELLKSAWIEGVDEGAEDVALAELVTRAADLRAEEKKPKASQDKA